MKIAQQHILHSGAFTLLITCCRLAVHAAEYRLVAKKGEGTFSEVLKAQCIKTGK